MNLDGWQVYELANAKNHPDRIALLKEWHKDGGIMIMGYQLFRILANYAGKSKKLKAVFNDTLTDPGPDLVICDEGHMLKNDASAVSKAMNKIRTKRRVILTGTPLQNNLIECELKPLNFIPTALQALFLRVPSRRILNSLLLTGGWHNNLPRGSDWWLVVPAAGWL